MKKILLIVSIGLVLISINGCAYRITDVNVKGKDKSCIRECTKSYSDAVSKGNQIGSKMETLRASKDAFVICVNTCDDEK